MSMREFLRRNRNEIDECIARVLKCKSKQPTNDNERMVWVLNDEGLYNWARSEGVKV
jgi:hypothetical protein